MTRAQRARSAFGTLAFLLVLAGALLATVIMQRPLADAAPLELVPCVTEDSDNCYWDADRQGNGHGRSFVTIGGETSYLTK